MKFWKRRNRCLWMAIAILLVCSLAAFATPETAPPAVPAAQAAPAAVPPTPAPAVAPPAMDVPLDTKAAAAPALLGNTPSICLESLLGCGARMASS